MSSSFLSALPAATPEGGTARRGGSSAASGGAPAAIPGAQVSIRRLAPVRATARAEGGGERTGGRRARFGGAQVVAAPPALAPRGVGQILDTAFDVFTARFAVCVAIGTLLMLPVEIGMEVYFGSRLREPRVLEATWGYALVGGVVQLLAAAGVCHVASAHLLAERVDPGAAIRTVLRKSLGVAALAVTVGPAAYLLFYCCVLPGVFAHWLTAVATTAYILETGWPGRAVARSVSLSWGGGSLGRWMGWASVSSLIVLPLTFFSEGGYNPMFRDLARRYLPLGWDETALLLAGPAALLAGMAVAYEAVVVVVYYYDLRVRREGLDLERELARLVARRGKEAA
ncbi:MAG: hypothetical protein AB1726_18030 [Planctomycetota bacterium]